LCVCFWHQRVINSNNLGAPLGHYIPSKKGGAPDPSPERHILLPSCGGPRFSQQWQLSRSVNELGL
jgi:hypothetical protein